MFRMLGSRISTWNKTLHVFTWHSGIAEVCKAAQILEPLCIITCPVCLAYLLKVLEVWSSGLRRWLLWILWWSSEYLLFSSESTSALNFQKCYLLLSSVVFIWRLPSCKSTFSANLCTLSQCYSVVWWCMREREKPSVLMCWLSGRRCYSLNLIYILLWLWQ